jgi:nucleoside-diphosphate-sugar epimerase
MMKTILITGANGEIGHGLVERYAQMADTRIIALDLSAVENSLKSKCYKTFIGDILDAGLIQSLSAEHDFDAIFHLAALLSTKAEREPTLAHRVNVDGTLNLLEMAAGQSRAQGRDVKFIYPSSIAVYGLPSLPEKKSAGCIKERESLQPHTMYGINKLYCEQLGYYYTNHYRQLDADIVKGKVDFRGIRFPGLISAATVPTGGTSDFAPEMLHAAAQNKVYPCFVREDTRIPFMAMPDAIDGLMKLESAPKQGLTQQMFNITAFNPTAGEILTLVKASFPNAQVSFVPDAKRQGILDSWPEDIDDSAARKDWGWTPSYDLQRAFDEYLIPGVVKRYNL